MRIACPQCAFERHVPEDRLPASSVIATCPHCQHRFRIVRPAEGQAAQTEQPYPTQQHTDQQRPLHATAKAEHISSQNVSHHEGEDDPLPPGAVIPSAGIPDSEISDHPKEDAPRKASPLKDTTFTPPASAKGSTIQADRPAPRTQPGPEDVSSEPRKTAPSAPSAPSRSGAPSASGAQDTHAEDDPEFRRAAAAAYEKQAEEGEHTFALDNPWEQPEDIGYAAAFYQTSMRVMFAAPRFFAGLLPDTPQRTALFFYLLVCVIQILVERFWGGVLSSFFAASATNDPQLQKLLEMLAPQTNVMLALLMRTALMTLELFVASGMYFLIFKLLAPAKANYQLVFQVMAYSTAPSLLCVVPVAGSIVGFIWSVACSFIGCRYALRLSWTQTVLGIVPLYVLGIPFFLQLVRSMQGVMG